MAWHGFRFFFVRMRDASSFAVVDNHAFAQIAILGMLSLAVFFLWKEKTLLPQVRSTSLRFILLYYSLCLASSLWSPMPSYSAYRAIEMIVLLLAVCLVVWRYENFFHAEKMVLNIGLSLILLRFASRLAMHDEDNFVVYGSNGFAASAMLLFLYSLAELPNALNTRRRKLAITMVISGICVLLGKSSASYLAVALAIFFLLLFSRSRTYKVLWFFGLATVLLFLLLGLTEIFSNIVFRGKSAQNITSLHGRVILWQAYANIFLSSPIYGQGFAVGERFGADWGAFYATNTHNSFISPALSTGMVGLIIFFCWLCYLFTEAILNLKRERVGSEGVLAAFIGAMVNSFTIPIISASWYETSTIFLLIMTLHLNLTMRAKYTPLSQLLAG